MTPASPSAQAERDRLLSEIRSLINTHIVEYAETHGALDIIRCYAETRLYLNYLSDIPTQMAVYGRAVVTLLGIEQGIEIVLEKVKEDRGLISICEKIEPLLRIAYKNSTPLVNMVPTMQLRYLADRKQKGANTKYEQATIKPECLLYYSEVLKTETFSKIVKQPVKDRCIELANALAKIIGLGFVLPGKDQLGVQLRHPDVRDFLSPSSVGNGNNIPLPKKTVTKIKKLQKALKALVAAEYGDVNE